jgi:hypothetical protein
MLLADHEQVYAFTRYHDTTELLVLANFSGGPATIEVPDTDALTADLVPSAAYLGAAFGLWNLIGEMGAVLPRPSAARCATLNDKGMAPQVVAHPGTRPTEKGEHCGHHQNTATSPRRPRPPGRVPPCLQRWLDNARQLVVDSSPVSESEEYALCLCRKCAERS